MKFWEAKNVSETESELILYGYIQSEKPWWSDGNTITPDEFLEDIKPFKTKNNITIRINSCGGDVFAATAIYTQLKTLSAKKTVIIDGIAASAATIIAMAADVIQIPANGLFMIHNPAVTVWDSFEVSELEKLIGMLETTKEALINAYQTRTKLSRDELAVMMDNETWMTGAEAVEKGFADEILPNKKESPMNLVNGRFLITNNISHDLSRFRNRPVFSMESVQEQKNTGGERAMTMETLIKDHADLVKQIEDSARRKGIQEERERLQEIEKIANTIHPELLNKARYEAPMDAKTLAFENAVWESSRGKKYLEDVQKDAEDSGSANVPTEPNQPPNGAKAHSEERIKSLAGLMNKDKRRG